MRFVLLAAALAVFFMPSPAAASTPQELIDGYRATYPALESVPITFIYEPIVIGLNMVGYAECDGTLEHCTVWVNLAWPDYHETIEHEYQHILNWWGYGPPDPHERRVTL